MLSRNELRQAGAPRGPNGASRRLTVLAREPGKQANGARRKFPQHKEELMSLAKACWKTTVVRHDECIENKEVRNAKAVC